jgi:hypothetical protein
MHAVVSPVENSSELVINSYIRNSNFQCFLPYSFPVSYVIEWSTWVEVQRHLPRITGIHIQSYHTALFISTSKFCGVQSESRNGLGDQGWFPRQRPTFPWQQLGIGSHPLLVSVCIWPQKSRIGTRQESRRVLIRLEHKSSHPTRAEDTPPR